MRKILFVANVVKTHIMQFHIPYLKWFKENGFEVHVYAKNDYEDKNSCKIPYCDYFIDANISRNPLSFNNYQSYQNLKQLIKDEKYTLVHCHTPIGGAIARLAVLSQKDDKPKIIYTAHGFHFFKGASILSWIFYFPIEKFLAKYSDAIITINQEDFDLAKSFRTNVFKVNGVGFQTERLNDSNTKFKRENLNINDNDKVLVSIGEIRKLKNQMKVVKTLKKMNDSRIHYIICGDGKYKKTLQKFVSSHNLNVHFVGYSRDVIRYLKISDAFIFPSLREGMPVALMEAMYVGLPILCSNIRGNKDLIQHLKNGYLFSPNNINSIETGIRYFIENKLKMETWGQENRILVENFTTQSVLGQVTEIYLKYL